MNHFRIIAIIGSFILLKNIAFSQGITLHGQVHWVVQGGTTVMVTNKGGLKVQGEAVFKGNENSTLLVTGSLINQTERELLLDSVVILTEDLTPTIRGNYDINHLTVASKDSIKLSGLLTINQNLTLNDGLLIIPAESQLLLSEHATQTASHSSYINGALAVKLESVGAKSLHFNIGTNLLYTPVLLTFNKKDNLPATISLRIADELPDLELPSFLEMISDKASWELQINGTTSAFSEGQITVPLVDEEIDETKITLVKSEDEAWKDLVGEVDIIDDRRVVRSTVNFEEAGVFAIGKSLSSRLEWSFKPAEGLVSSSTPQETQLIFTNVTTLNSPSVELKYRSLRKEMYDSISPNQDGNTFVASISEELFEDDFGIAYFFEFKDNTGRTYKSDEQYVYYKYPSNHFQQPLHAGTEPSDYQIVAVPLNLDNKTVAGVMEDDFGVYDSALWRLFHYQNGDYEEYDNPQNNIERGKGYWLITKEEKSLTFGDGDMSLTNNESFIISLDTGWNQIGNPYHFDIPWENILTYNNLATNNLEIIGYRHGRVVDLSQDTLHSFEGAFVRANNALSLQIPIRTVSTTGGRTQASSAKGANGWTMSFSLSGEKTGYDIAGFGMHAGASEEADPYDMKKLPRFIHYLDIDFGKGLTRDIVPVQDSYVWNFTVSSNHADGQSVTLSWNNLSSIDHPYQLILLDQVNLLPINMRQANQYTFKLKGGKRPFVIFYGTDEGIREQMQPNQIAVGQVYPNPTVRGLNFPISIPHDHQIATVSIRILDMTGRQIRSLQKDVPPGYQVLHWDGYDQQGKPADTGMYLYQLIVSGTEKVFMGKFLVQP